MAYYDLANYCDSAQYTAVAQWAATTVYTVGNIRRPLTVPAVGNERCYVCTTPGTSGSTEPVWTFTRGAIQPIDGTAHWQEATGLAALNGDSTNTQNWAAARAVATAVTLGALIKNGAANTYFICTTAGTMGASEPTWNTTAGATTADSTVTWTSLGAISGFSGTWKAPHARLANASTTNWLSISGQIIFVGDDHAETQASAITIVNSGGSCSILCVDHTVAVPPGVANLKTSATITDSSTGSFIIFSTGSTTAYVYGVQFLKTGVGQVWVQYGAARLKFEQCTFTCAGSVIDLGVQGQGGWSLDFLRCTFNSSTANLAIGTGPLTLKGCTMIGTFNGVLFSSYSSTGPVLVEGCDLSSVTGALVAYTASVPSIIIKDCKLAPGVVNFNGAGIAPVGLTLDYNRCDSGGTAYRNERHHNTGDETTSTSVARTTGAQDGATPVSHQITTTTNLSVVNLAPAGWSFPAIPLAIWNAVTGTNRNVTLYGVANDTRVPTNAEVWADVEYLGSAASPQGSVVTNFPGVLAAGTALTVDTSAWDTVATARVNSHAYVVGNVIKLASNPGRIFFCTTAGTSAASEPGGYASAVDGGSVTDGGATFRAGCRFSMIVTLSSPQPAQVGYLYVYPKFGRASQTYYLDPLIALS